jgi:hypothetical protein
MPDGCGFEPDEENAFFQFAQSFQPHLALGFANPPTEMSNRSRKMTARKTDNLTAISEPTG